ncbi:MAG: DUF5009 domain-containing protein [Candidatus Hydrogenedentes bacterium]|nr:DUF5009 domain-containing protein [Candidatus Hydrogenedentota bacterium]
MENEAPAHQTTEAQTGAAGRVAAVDVLRGFDMFWLIGGTGFGIALARLLGGDIGAVLETQFEHAQWIGFRFYDLIFPLFVFLVGMSLVFSLEKRLQTGGRWAAYKRLLRRAVLLYLMGLVYYGGVSKEWPDIRLLGVLQRLALCYLFAGILFIHLRPRGLIIACFFCLIGYWALLSFVPVPGTGQISFDENANWAWYLDKQFLPGHKHYGDYDPEGLLSTIPSVATCLLGVFAAFLLRTAALTPWRKVLLFIGGGACLVAVGHLWGLQFPVIKKIWTSSYVLVAGGYSFALLGFFYMVVDIFGFRAWARPLLWIGANPLTIYMAKNIVDFNALALRFVGGDVQRLAGEDWGYLLQTGVSLALALLVVWFLYRRKIFLRL